MQPDTARPRLETQFIAKVAERDVDLVVLEELSVSTSFANFITSLAFGRPIFGTAVAALHSLEDGKLGESDLVFVFDSNDGQRIALLIENKIDAPAQPTQAQRYQKRGEKGKTEGLWDDHLAVVIAPKRYLEGGHGTGDYGAEISYEEIMAYFLSRRSGDARFDYKARVIREAIEQNRRGYQPQISRDMTSFVEQYTRLAELVAPDLNVESARPRPAASTWIAFRPRGYPKKISLYHQITAGRVKLFWAGKSAEEDEFRRVWEAKIPAEVLIERTGKSMALVMEVPKLDPTTGTIQGQEEDARAGLAAVRRVDEVFRKAMRLGG
jgi:hypothetical protein